MARPVAPKRAPTMEEMLTAPPATIFEVRLGQATYIRQAANDLYGDEKYEDALKLYERALFHCNFENAEMKFEMTNEYKKNLRETVEPVYLNLALCCLKLKRYKDVMKYAKSAIHSESSDITKCKASYLIGKALVCLGEYEEALKYLSELDPSFPVDKCHTALQKEAKEGIARNKRKDQEVWKGKLKSQPEVAATSSQQSRGSTDGIWMAVVVLLIAIALGVVIFFTSQAPS